MVFDNQTPTPAADEQARRNRQAELVRLLEGGNEPTQWIALKELAKVGDKAAAGVIYNYTLSKSPDLAAAARIAYRQIQERMSLGRATTADDDVVPPQGAPDAPQLEQDYLAQQAPPPVVPPASAPLPPPVAAMAPPPPPPQAPPLVVESSEPVFKPSDFGEDDGRTEPLPVEAEPFGAPVTDAEEAALLPDDDVDRGLLPQ
jgi:hypothetical protein